MDDCGHSREQHELHGCPDIGMPPLSQDKTAMMLGLVLPFEDGLDESHRDGHETRWEMRGDVIVCSTCGWSYRLT